MSHSASLVRYGQDSGEGSPSPPSVFWIHPLPRQSSIQCTANENPQFIRWLPVSMLEVLPCYPPCCSRTLCPLAWLGWCQQGKVRGANSRIGTDPVGCKGGKRGFPGLSLILPPHLTPSGDGIFLREGENWTPPVSKEEEEPMGSAACSAHIIRLLQLSLLLFSPLPRLAGLRLAAWAPEPLGTPAADSSPLPLLLSGLVKHKPHAWEAQAWLTALFKCTAWPPMGYPRRCIPGGKRG